MEKRKWEVKNSEVEETLQLMLASERCFLFSGRVGGKAREWARCPGEASGYLGVDRQMCPGVYCSARPPTFRLVNAKNVFR
ncbi:hypothetical protein E2C01_057505 [Portunus trituberculatus]|uniref:Uncharacterized protein n=1 Tax=Portunus trituberculatus TaxID=210409 RepID=A0A5B7H228_PORTR|nr:hypothetical protein [Portunus trituberculatus]